MGTWADRTPAAGCRLTPLRAGLVVSDRRSFDGRGCGVCNRAVSAESRRGCTSRSVSCFAFGLFWSPVPLRHWSARSAITSVSGFSILLPSSLGFRARRGLADQCTIHYSVDLRCRCGCRVSCRSSGASRAAAQTGRSGGSSSTTASSSTSRTSRPTERTASPRFLCSHLSKADRRTAPRNHAQHDRGKPPGKRDSTSFGWAPICKKKEKKEIRHLVRGRLDTHHNVDV